MRPEAMFLALCVVLELFAGAGRAHAEFQLSGPAVSPAPAPGYASRPEGPPARRAPRRVGPAIAYGFGNQAPLDFAARQIVPRGVKVAFGDDLDPAAALVDWKGGRPWPDVLRSTLRLAGLHVTFRPGAALIERGSAP